MHSHINASFGHDIPITEWVEICISAIGYQSQIAFDSSSPTTPRTSHANAHTTALCYQAKADETLDPKLPA